MNHFKTIAIAALFASLAACNLPPDKNDFGGTFLTPNMYNGQPYTGNDPVTKVSASNNDITRCKDKGGVKNTNPIASLGGGFYPADCVK